MTNNNNENNQFPIIKLYIFIHMIKFEINSNYTDKSCIKIFLENFARIVQKCCSKFLVDCLSRVESSNGARKESIPACVTVEQASRSVQTRTWVSEIGDADSSRPSPTFHQRSKFPLSRGWMTMKRFDRSAHCSARTRGQPLEPFELVNCSSQRTGTVNSPSEIPLMDRIWIYRSTRARSAAVTGFLATGPDPKYPSPCCRRVIYANLLNLQFAFRWHCKF